LKTFFLSFLAYTYFDKTFLERYIKKVSKLGLYLKDSQLFSTFLDLKTGNHDNKIILKYGQNITCHILGTGRNK